MKRHLVVLSLALVAFAMPGEGVSDPLGLGYQLTFEDNFEQLQVSSEPDGRAKWYNRTPWDGDFGAASFASSTQNGTFSVADGILSITIQKDETGQWTSGLLSSLNPQGQGFAQQYGYFEICARLPEGAGVWPAFWLIGQERLIAASTITAEIDILEHYGAIPDAFSAKWHVWHRDGSKRHEWEYRRKQVKPGELTSGFHTYGVHITEQTTAFYYDGTEHWSVPTPEEHRQPMMILLNLGLGGGWPVSDDVDGRSMEIDYIRAFASQ